VAELTDEKIMLRVRDGNLSELSELFERYHVRLYNFFLKLTYDRPVSEDLTQNLFYRVIKYSHTYDQGSGTFKTWIYRMARNAHADYYKQQQKTAMQFKQVDEEHRENIPANEGTYNEDHFEKLEKALLQLQPDQREIIVLSRYQGLRYTEISKIKDISVPAIKVQVHRAMKQLKALYFKLQ
jgi:RNA polymerase sigma-70 factor (ECF subfamily)